MSPRARRWLPAALLFVAGLLVVFITHGFVGAVIGWSINGVAGVWLVSLLFYEVGLSEDRERDARR